MSPRVIGVKEAATYLSCSVRFIRRLVAERRIRHYKVGKFLRFDLKDLDNFLEQGLREVNHNDNTTTA